MTTNFLVAACLFVLPLAIAFADTLQIEGFKPFHETHLSAALCFRL
jgi:hypothetical protein